MENILYRSTRHPIYIIIKISEYILGYGLFLAILFVLDYLLGLGGYFYLFVILGFLVLGLMSYIYYDKFYKSKFVITNTRIYMTVQTGLWSSYEMSIFWSNVKDFAYSRNHFLHKILDYGNIRIRSGTNKESEFYASDMPDIGHIYSIINYIYMLSAIDRQSIAKLPQNFIKSENTTNIYIDPKPNSTSNINDLSNQIISKLLKVKGITQGIVLDNLDREYIGNHEEERNHGVYECIRKKYLICIVHDSDFRNPDADIVIKYNYKVIFPAVPFHEVSLSTAISSSPSILIHRYLSEKFTKKSSVELSENDATILIGFDDL